MEIQKDRMLAGELYIANDPDLTKDRQRAMALAERFNASPSADRDARTNLLRELLGSFGEGTEIRPPFHCDFGISITVGSRTFINFRAMMLDVAPIAIGDDCNKCAVSHPDAPTRSRTAAREVGGGEADHHRR